MIGARAALSMVIVGALASPVAAQRAQPVEGGGSFNDAPIVTAGRYRDTIRPKEKLFYAIEVLEGQKLNARAIINSHLTTDESPIRSDLRVHTPNRDEIPGEISILSVWIGRTNHRLTGDVVGESRFYTEPGLYYIALTMGNGPRTQFDVDLKFTLKGTPVEATPTESPSPIEEETPEEEQSPEPTPEDTEEPRPDTGSAAPPAGGDDELPVGMFVAFFVAGALGGSAIELFRGGRARGRA